MKAGPNRLGLVPASGLGLVVGLGLAGCEPTVMCEEDIRAQVLDDRIDVVVGGQSLTAELADEANERERGWKHRRCGREALALVPDVAGEPVPIWGCALVEPIDVAFVSGGEIVELVEGLVPCDEPCQGCELIGEGLAVDLVLEIPAGALQLEVGQAVAAP